MESSSSSLNIDSHRSSSSLPLLSLLFLLLLSLSSTTTNNLVQGFPASSSSLYTSADSGVNILYTTNITDFIVNQHQDGRKIQFIQFFNTYCGHCQAFAPLFKQFLQSTIHRWSNVVDFAVLDCANEVNADACRHYNIELYPTLRTFWLRPKLTDLGEDFPLHHWTSAADLRQSFIGWLSDQYEKHNINDIPKHWPNFLPLKVENKEQLFEKLDIDNDHRPVLIIVEKNDSLFGQELMMNFSLHTNELRIFRMEESSDNKHLLQLSDQNQSNALEKISLPFLYVITPENHQIKVIPKPIMSDEDDGIFMTKLIAKDFVKNYDHEEMNLKKTNDDETLPDQSTVVVKYSTRIYMSDLHNAIRYALFHEVPLKQYLNQEQTNSLIRLLNVLYESFRFQNDKTKQFIKHFHDWLVKHSNRNARSSRSGKSSLHNNDMVIDTKDMLTTMNMYEEYYHFPEQKPWKACAVISDGYHRSYPCSLWTLFHVLTVAEYRRTLQTKQWLSLHPTLYAMREYIRNFFGCTECSMHFTKMSSMLENELTYPNSSVLWLWRAHNRVNARLKGSRSEDPRLPKRQFPLYNECNECYRKQPPDDLNLWKNSTKYIEYYDETKILQFLVNFYASERIILDDSEFNDQQQQQQPQQKQSLIDFDHPIMITDNDDSVTNHATKPRSKILMLVSSPFTQTDINLIFVFYVVSIILLLSIFVYVRSRRNIFHKVFNLNGKQRVY
ncbi:sulfhydryl oxidase 1-like [Dermatophagoides pteronyssinus]|uniref:sulfhydryl oxidase 1-like n=1 Tax=Dermatophagoides pteronyssinus TaxID=6956 RepID=UPI003F6707C2